MVNTAQEGQEQAYQFHNDPIHKEKTTAVASYPSALVTNTPTIQPPSGDLTTMRSSGRAHFATVVVMVRDARVKEKSWSGEIQRNSAEPEKEIPK